MTGRRPKETGLSLTELELEIMNLIWNQEETTIREVCDLINQEKDFAYTTVATVFKSLEKKGYLDTAKQGNTSIYKAKIEREKFQDWFSGHKLAKIFKNPESLVSKFIEETNLSKKEIEKIKNALKDLEF